MKKVIFGALLISAVCAGFPTFAQGEQVAGMYENIPIGYDENSEKVSGYYYQTTVAGQFSCIFYFSGKLKGNKANIVSYFPNTPKDKIKGTVKFLKGGKMEIKLVEEHGGCWNVWHFADAAEPADFELKKRYPEWTAIDVVKSDRAYFYEQTDEDSKTKSYVVVGDAVAVVEQDGEWVKAEYAGGKKLVSGYIKKADMYGLAE